MVCICALLIALSLSLLYAFRFRRQGLETPNCLRVEDGSCGLPFPSLEALLCPPQATLLSEPRVVIYLHYPVSALWALGSVVEGMSGMRSLGFHPSTEKGKQTASQAFRDFMPFSSVRAFRNVSECVCVCVCTCTHLCMLGLSVCVCVSVYDLKSALAAQTSDCSRVPFNLCLFQESFLLPCFLSLLEFGPNKCPNKSLPGLECVV